MLSVYTNSVARAYFLPLRGLEGAGEGGRSCPSKSILENAFPKALAFDEPEEPEPSTDDGLVPDMTASGFVAW